MTYKMLTGRTLIAVVLAGMVSFTTMGASAQEANDPSAKKEAVIKRSDAEIYELLNLLGDAFERVRSGYVDEVDEQKLVETAISGMLSALDPHSSYLDSKTFQEMQVRNKGEFGGLGIEVTMENGVVKVVSPIDDTPAFEAGIQTGDFITHIDGDPVIGLTLSDAVDRMRGPVGKKIVITIVRKDIDPFDVEIIRATIKIRTVRSRVIDNIGYVRITQFNAQATAGLEKAFRKFKKEAGDKPLQGVVLDLRSNPGGLLEQAISVSDVFLEKGEVVSIRSEKRPEEAQRFNARPGDLTEGLPVVVLVNGGSASASEIVAGALQDHGRATIIGTQSFGKGSVQTILPMKGYGALKMTTSRYYTPSGRSIHSIGIAPDIVVELPKPKVEKTDKADDKPKPKPKANGESNPEDDPQLMRALDFIRTMSMHQNLPSAETAG